MSRSAQEAIDCSFELSGPLYRDDLLATDWLLPTSCLKFIRPAKSNDHNHGFQMNFSMVGPSLIGKLLASASMPAKPHGFSVFPIFSVSIYRFIE
jgi:hypothetical protein